MPMHSRSLLLAVTAASLTAACVDPPFDPIPDEFPPKGVMHGTVTYSGPMPCGVGGHIRGNANILLFNINLLPPPEGLGVTAQRIAAVSGDVLFADVAPQIPADGCPPAGTPPVTVTADFELGPIDPGVYQARGFFDYDGDFSPVFNFANLPTKGDVGGGAIANIADVIKNGAAPAFQQIPVGIQQSDGTWAIPPEGFVVSNVGVTLSDAALVTTNRPYFYISNYAPAAERDGTIPTPVDNPTEIKIPADFEMWDGSLANTEKSIFKFTLASGLPTADNATFPGDENDISKRPPFYFHTGDQIFLSAYDANHDGILGNDKTIPSPLLAAIAPVVTLAKIDTEVDPIVMRTTQTHPFVLSSAITAPKGIMTAIAAPATPTGYDSFSAFLPPTVVCAQDPANAHSKTVIVSPYQKDTKGADIITDPDRTKSEAAKQLQRDPAAFSIVYRCLPPGHYAINAIYPATTQAWSLPNESGMCMSGEAPGQVNGLPTCGAREKLSSQAVHIQIVGATDPNYCNSLRPASGEVDDYADACLTASELQRYRDGTLWNP